jgi:hypothetical protein
MSDERRPDIDRQIRDAFEPEPLAAIRIARAALAARADRRFRWTAVAAAAAVIVLAASLAFWPRPEPITEPAPGSDAMTSLTGSFTDGVLVMSAPDGSVTIVGGVVREDRPPDGYGFVLVEGELR